MMNAKLIVKGKEFDIEILDPELQDLLSSSQKHGHWRIDSDGYYSYCSECGKEPQERVMADVCSHCGAKMIGENNMADYKRLTFLIDDFISTVDIAHWYSEELDEKLAEFLINNDVTFKRKCPDGCPGTLNRYEKVELGAE